MTTMQPVQVDLECRLDNVMPHHRRFHPVPVLVGIDTDAHRR